jgi:glycosyltransferase involved in cell wall biosynthesis
MNQRPKYSIITICKGRLHHLVRSLPAMLHQPLSEVVVVDYGCPDQTADYVTAHFPNARVVRVPGVTGFNASHARNRGAGAAAGDTFAFVDADVILADHFIASTEASLAPDNYAKLPDANSPRDNSVQGTCVIHRRHFELVGGYDEVLVNYGGEDLELYERLAFAKVERQTLPADVVREVIDHSQAERMRFFSFTAGAEAGFLIGKVYRIAIGMMIRLDETFVIDRDLRTSIYQEITRLVGNMVERGERNLRLDITFPDGGGRGLHQRWQFTRSIAIRVDPRGDPVPGTGS